MRAGEWLKKRADAKYLQFKPLDLPKPWMFFSRCSYDAMTKREKKKVGINVPSVDKRRKGKGKKLVNKNVDLIGNVKLIERVRQIISETPEIREDKIAPLLEAVEQGTYGLDVKKLANILIAKLFLDP